MMRWSCILILVDFLDHLYLYIKKVAFRERPFLEFSSMKEPVDQTPQNGY